MFIYVIKSDLSPGAGRIGGPLPSIEDQAGPDGSTEAVNAGAQKKITQVDALEAFGEKDKQRFRRLESRKQWKTFI